MRDREGIEAAIEGFLRLGAATEHSTGILNDWLRVQAFLDEVPGGLDSAETSVKKLEIVSLDGETALVDLDANWHWTATDLWGKSRSGNDHFIGPVELIRTDGGWKVDNIVRNGVRLGEATFPSTLSVTRGDLSVRALMGRYDGSTLRVVFESVYGGPLPLEILGYDLAVRNFPFGWTWAKSIIASRDRFPPGENRFFVDAAFKTCPTPPLMRVVFRTNHSVLELGSRTAKRR